MVKILGFLQGWGGKAKRTNAPRFARRVGSTTEKNRVAEAALELTAISFRLLNETKGIRAFRPMRLKVARECRTLRRINLEVTR